MGQNFIRTELDYGSRHRDPLSLRRQAAQVRWISIPPLLQAKGLSPLDIVTTIGAQNLILPSGTAKIGSFEYQVDMNSPATVNELNDLPMKTVNGSTIYIRDVAFVRDGFRRRPISSGERTARRPDVRTEDRRCFHAGRYAGVNKMLPRRGLLPPHARYAPASGPVDFRPARPSTASCGKARLPPA